MPAKEATEGVIFQVEPADLLAIVKAAEAGLPVVKVTLALAVKLGSLEVIDTTLFKPLTVLK